MKTQDYIDLEEKWSAHNFSPLPVVLHKGEGAWVWDVEGKKYLDMISGYSVLNAGYCHPRIVAALIDQASRLGVSSRAYYNDILPSFLKKLCTLVGQDLALPMNTGAEAVDTAIKAIRRWGYRHRNVPENKGEIIVCENNFHGRTVAAISLSTTEKYKTDFGPLLPGIKVIPFGDLKAFEAAITDHTCGAIVEAIQGEAGIIVPHDGWLKGIAEICKRKGIVLVVDEVQSGLGRTGKILACEHENVKPDAIILGKALGGGIYPVSALVGSNELMGVFDVGSHGSTFGGNPIAAAIAIRALEVMEEEELPKRSAELGAYFIEELRKISCPLIREVRGRGLWVGIDFNPNLISARRVCEALLKQGVLSKETHETVARFAPALVISKDDLDWGIQRIKQALTELAP